MGRIRLLLFYLLLLLQACSVQKNTLMTRTFHNITAHYNIYFNARESYRKGMAKAEKQFAEDFTNILEVFPEDDPSVAGSLEADMDRVITKTSKLISNHSIKAKPVSKKSDLSVQEKNFYNKPEYNKWVDDSYLLMGKAQYRKNDLQSALQTFSYIVKTYPDPDITNEASIWVTKTLDRMGKFSDAQENMENVKNKVPEMSLRLHGLYYAVYANHYLMQDKPEKAFPLLEKAYQYARKRTEKYRYAFILGQLAQQSNDYAAASKYFKKVLSHKPEYIYAFNARILLAESSGTSGQEVKDVKKDLRKLLRDKKNKEYKDQIYYAFGKLSQNENNQEEAISYFKKSAISSVNNSLQKAESYLEIANIYFERNNYIQSQQYYDSAVQVLPNNFPEYEQIKAKSLSLNKLATYLNEVELQDSLQMLAGLSNTERTAIIDNIIDQVREEERKAKEAQQLPNYSPGMEMQNQIRFQEELQRGGKWYFYNPSALGFGRNEFKRKWGTRRLEDNWRRKNKMSTSFDVASGQNGSDSLTVRKDIPLGDRTSRSFYLKQIPLTDSMKAISNNKIREGLFESALIYRNDFQDMLQAEKNLLTLIQRFPSTDNSYLLPSYFTLYQIYKENGGKTEQEKYKNLIIQKFPESEQAKILGDPLYLKKVYEKQKENEEKYEAIYQQFILGNYELVTEQCNKNLQQQLPPDLHSKYLFLYAQAMGHNGDIRAYKNALNEVSNKASDPQIISRAKEIINYLNTTHPVLKQEELEVTAKEIYHYAPDQDHRFIFVAPKKNADANQIKFDILNFNTDYAPQQDLPVVEKEGFSDTLVFVVPGLGNAAEAMKYFSKLGSDSAMAAYLNDKRFSLFLISEDNVETLFKDKRVDPYRIFFQKYYLKPSGNNED